MRYNLKRIVLVYVLLTLLYNPYESTLFQITSFTRLLKAINTTAGLGMYRYFLLYHIPLDFSLLYEAQTLLLDGGMMVEVAFIK